MNEADDELLFAEEEGDDHSSVEGGWKVLLVDDEPSVHEVTKMALETFRFEHQKIDFYHAYSAAEGREIMRAEEGVALVLLDVVMETAFKIGKKERIGPGASAQGEILHRIIRWSPMGAKSKTHRGLD